VLATRGKVEVSGQVSENSVTTGLVVSLTGAGSTVRDLVINGFQVMIDLEGGSNTVQGNLLGTDVRGTALDPAPLGPPTKEGFPLDQVAILLRSSHNQIGGIERGNVIAVGWTDLPAGLVGEIDDLGSAGRNVIEGNSIGAVEGVDGRTWLDPAGAPPSASDNEEVSLLLGGPEQVGGDLPGQGNLVATGGTVVGDGSVFQGNTFLDSSLNVAARTTIGGATTAAGAGDGNHFLGASPEPHPQLVIATSSTPPAGQNLPYAPLPPHIVTSPGGAGTTVQGNLFEDDADDSAIEVGAPGTTIGGAGAALGNVIEHNATTGKRTEYSPAGVLVDIASDESSHTLVEDNRFEDNGDAGAVNIDDGYGVTLVANSMVGNSMGITFGGKYYLDNADLIPGPTTTTVPGRRGRPPTTVPTPTTREPDDYQTYPLLFSADEHDGTVLKGRFVEPATFSGTHFEVDAYAVR
jgi:hypothetical protein